MIKVHPAASRYSFDHGWIRGNYSFSFGDYHDSDNTRFGPLRVFNDDTLAPGRGFGAHPHSDMEIVSIVVTGQLRHEDNYGHVAVSTFGEVQRMSAGTGIIHTEHNVSDTEELNLLQLWFMPEKKGLEPSYEMTRFDTDQLAGRLLPVVAPQGSEQVAAIHQDMTIYLSKLEGSQKISFSQPVGRRVLVFVIEGQLTINEDTALQKRDSARITDVPQLELAAEGSAFFVLIDLP
jgi:quercetin 2,3-dioxygenase